jgi:SPP1 gp7 family putative phage head morphogenesis protein
MEYGIIVHVLNQLRRFQKMKINLPKLFQQMGKKTPKRIKPPMYPLSPERSLNRLLQSLVNEAERSYKRILKPKISLSKKTYGYKTDEDDSYWKALSSWEASVDAIFLSEEVRKKATQIYKRLISQNTNAINMQSQQVVGVNIASDTDSYLPAFLSGQTKKHTRLIKDVSRQIKDDIAGIIQRGAMQGTSTEQIIQEIEEGLQGRKGRFRTARTRAELIARTEIANFNSELTAKRYSDANLETYIRHTAGDNRVRPEHAKLDGLVFRWDEPPPEGHPGTTFRCRCVAGMNPDELIGGENAKKV